VLIDTHCHLYFNSFKEDLEEVLDRARSADVARIVVPATDIPSCMEVIELSQRIPEVYAAIGIHPNDAGSFSLHDVDCLKDLAREPKVVAIGEIGLDIYHDDVDMKRQIVAFEAQLDLAEELNLPVLIHNRDADEQVGKILRKWTNGNVASTKSRPVKGIMHAFSSSESFARFVLDIGFFVGAAGPITFKNAGERREVFRKIDLEKIVLETDAPFLTPQPFRGKRNEPSYTKFIAEEFSRLWDLPISEVHSITTKNAARIFQWN
jgi:TatD DNase family protein